MTTRRSFVTGLMALPAFTDSWPALADDARFTVGGAMEQGSLALGQAPAGSRVAPGALSSASVRARPLRRW